ncbi:hypothetical protein BDV34DRAFT_177317 [Aspergillus parasiticus]|uniref:Uncharacterized protein n=1 Tax=Aspergillus parasiticus TaxID=5067 RepID=A0A5N6DYV9_ASPPA|nr:hypothetical protein BDV34DRAFT_177317 [Aspergillus parasiticus]
MTTYPKEFKLTSIVVATTSDSILSIAFRVKEGLSLKKTAPLGTLRLTVQEKRRGVWPKTPYCSVDIFSNLNTTSVLFRG